MATKPQPVLTLLGAKAAVTAAEIHAKNMGIPMNIAVCDSATHLLSFTRMDGAKITSINIAIDKAFTAAGHRIPTSSYKENVWPGGVAFGIWNTNNNRFCTIGGGVPILDCDGRVLGAVGCSTGTPMQDEEVAIAGRDAVLAMLEEERVADEKKRMGDEQAEPRSKKAKFNVKPAEAMVVEEVMVDEGIET